MWCAEWITGRRRRFLQQPAQPEADHGQGHHKWKQEEPLQPIQPHAFIYVQYLLYHAETTDMKENMQNDASLRLFLSAILYY